jgi:hypothetical protein
MRTELWVELISKRDQWGYIRTETGKVLKRRPKNREGFFVKVEFDLPTEITVDARVRIS